MNWERLRRQLAQVSGMDRKTVDRLVDIYGSRAGDVLALGEENPLLLEKIDEESGAIGAELVFTFENEFCRTLTDALIRRIMVGLNGNCGRQSLKAAANILAARQGWDDERKEREIADYLNYIRRFDVVGKKRPATDMAAE